MMDIKPSKADSDQVMTDWFGSLGTLCLAVKAASIDRSPKNYGADEPQVVGFAVHHVADMNSYGDSRAVWITTLALLTSLGMPFRPRLAATLVGNARHLMLLSVSNQEPGAYTDAMNNYLREACALEEMIVTEASAACNHSIFCDCAGGAETTHGCFYCKVQLPCNWCRGANSVVSNSAVVEWQNEEVFEEVVEEVLYESDDLLCMTAEQEQAWFDAALTLDWVAEMDSDEEEVEHHLPGDSGNKRDEDDRSDEAQEAESFEQPAALDDSPADTQEEEEEVSVAEEDSCHNGEGTILSLEVQEQVSAMADEVADLVLSSVVTDASESDKTVTMTTAELNEAMSVFTEHVRKVQTIDHMIAVNGRQHLVDNTPLKPWAPSFYPKWEEPKEPENHFEIALEPKEGYEPPRYIDFGDERNAEATADLQRRRSLAVIAAVREGDHHALLTIGGKRHLYHCQVCYLMAHHMDGYERGWVNDNGWLDIIHKEDFVDWVGRNEELECKYDMDWGIPMTVGRWAVTRDPATASFSMVPLKMMCAQRMGWYDTGRDAFNQVQLPSGALWRCWEEPESEQMQPGIEYDLDTRSYVLDGHFDVMHTRQCKCVGLVDRYKDKYPSLRWVTENHYKTSGIGQKGPLDYEMYVTFHDERSAYHKEHIPLEMTRRNLVAIASSWDTKTYRKWRFVSGHHIGGRVHSAFMVDDRLVNGQREAFMLVHVLGVCVKADPTPDIYAIARMRDIGMPRQKWQTGRKI